jgi:predicted nicotinamide N-methyase
VTQTVELEGGELSLLQPAEGAEIPDDGPVEWAPIAPYWSILWRSGLALAREVAGTELDGQRVIELGSGLGLPSLAAARSGAEVLAVDVAPEAIELLEANARRNGVRLEAALADWSRPDPLLERGPFDLVLGADVLYERQNTAPLLSLLPRLAPEAWIADPGRPAATSFLHQADQRWKVETSWRGVVSLSRIRL